MNKYLITIFLFLSSTCYGMVIDNPVIFTGQGASGQVLTLQSGGTSIWQSLTTTISPPAFISGQKFSKSFVITNPTAAADLAIWRVPVACTITAVHLLCKTQIIVGQLWQFDANGLNGATVDSSDITGVVNTNVNDDGSLSAPSITALNYVGWNTTSATAGATYAIITFEGKYD